MICLFILIGMNISCDQITKKEVREHVQKDEKIEIIDTNFILTHVENTGAAMSTGSNLSPRLKIIFLQILPIIFMVGLIIYLFKNIHLPKSHQFAMACIIGGGIGNLIDRVKFNSVTDFLFIEVGPIKTGIFNMADVSICFGALIILVSTIFFDLSQKLKHSRTMGN